MAELKPCPFCGEEAVIQWIEPHTHTVTTFIPDYEGGAFIECTGCTAAISGKTKQETITAWNTRAAEPEPKALTVEELRGMIGKPVWIEDLLIPKCSEWHLVVDDVGSIRLYGHLSIPSGYVGYNATTGHGYGKTWLAYDRRPKGE